MHDFQKAPKIQAFFKDLGVQHSPLAQTMGARPISPPRPAQGMPAGAPLHNAKPVGKLPVRVPPRFAKANAARQSGAQPPSAEKPKAKELKQRPKTRNSDSERESEDEAMTKAKPSKDVKPPLRRRPSYDLGNISPDPPTEEEKMEKMKKKKDKPKSKVPPVPAPHRPPSEDDDQIATVFKQCRLGKYREVEKALEDGLSVETRFGPKNDTMLLVCAMNGQKRIAKLLLRNKADSECRLEEI